MVRQSRIDFPGALHHIMVRGIERRNIFKDEKDKESFLSRLESVLVETETICNAFSLMDNHVHLLLQTGATSISLVMQSLLTGYAINFNHRHHRTGKLYQNRFKSVLCDKDDYFLQLVRYIHLNPLRVGLVSDIRGLDKYPWTGHAVIMGKVKVDWLGSEEVLLHFGKRKKEAQKGYREFIREGLNEEEAENLRGGGLIRSLGGLWETLKLSKSKKGRESGDERILGSGAFVEAVLEQTEEKELRASKLQREGWDFQRVLGQAGEAVGMIGEDLLHRGRADKRSAGRALLCKWLADDLGASNAFIAMKLGVTPGATSRLIRKGRITEKTLGVVLA